MTIRDWFTTNFNQFEPHQIENFNTHCNTQIKGVSLMSAPTLQFTCGGDCIMAFNSIHSTQKPIWLVRDNHEGHEWEFEQRLPNPESRARRHKPHAKLKLVQIG